MIRQEGQSIAAAALAALVGSMVMGGVEKKPVSPPVEDEEVEEVVAEGGARGAGVGEGTPVKVEGMKFDDMLRGSSRSVMGGGREGGRGELRECPANVHLVPLPPRPCRPATTRNDRTLLITLLAPPLLPQAATPPSRCTAPSLLSISISARRRLLRARPERVWQSRRTSSV